MDSSPQSTSESPKPSATPSRKIVRLDPTVVNRIAAGEVIHRPSSAVKELLENSLDAGSSSITVTAKDGGMKLLQVQDNGHGIKLEDMDILCERFTTSKLQKYEDLSSISTFGFRGEALASISHVAHVNIISKTPQSQCAYRAHYSDGKLIPPKPGDSAAPKPCAGVTGTQINVEDLFFNVSTRRKALTNLSDEFSRIAEIVMRYAVDNPLVSFTCKKFGETKAVIHTMSSPTSAESIKTLYGPAVAKELLPVSCSIPEISFSLTGYISNANYNSKKLTFILFINKRLVECSSIKRAIEATYLPYLPKHTHPFVYLSLKLSPADVDVNVHPTKQEVKFLHEEEIIEAIQKELDTKLQGGNSSRSYSLQTALPSVTILAPPKPRDESDFVDSISAQPQPNQLQKAALPTQTSTAQDSPQSLLRSKGAAPSATLSATKALHKSPSISNIPDHKLVRTDSKMQTLDTFLANATPKKRFSQEDEDFAADPPIAKRKILEESRAPPIKTQLLKTNVRLTSVRNLISEVNDNCHSDLLELIRDHTYVGYVTPSLSLIQYRTKLYLVNVCNLSKDLMYQQTLARFAHLSAIRLNPPAPISELVKVAIDSPETGWRPEDGDPEQLAQSITDLLKSRAAMLDEYFAIGIDENGLLTTIPRILENHIPRLERLPMFLLRLGSEVDWTAEQSCFQGIASEIANFYCIDPLDYVHDGGLSFEHYCATSHYTRFSPQL
eukprot:TRINITY_DN4181_c0_g1_i1.p1 TRINITY_DN4181_c0_g1~~TRINITY_DN4181_c0_g1_i1.p1  ORF type:complete len:725 (-),score=164.77 TRINITY_DN4181_c0_g1_i1:66-2240(-)